MNNGNNVNSSIGCNVTDCSYHNKQNMACSLSSIQVGRCGPTTASSACTECDSFEMKKPGRS